MLIHFPARRPHPSLATLAALLLYGCTPLSKGTFINGTDDPLALSLENDPPGPFRRLDLAPGRPRTCTIHLCDQAIVRDSGGEPLFMQTRLFVQPWQTYQGQGERRVYYLVTDDGIYPIPLAWRREWRQRVGEITARPVQWNECPSLETTER